MGTTACEARFDRFKTDLSKSKFDGSSMVKTTMNDALCLEAQMHRVVLTGATIQRSSFVKSVLQSCQLDNVVASDLDFTECRMAAISCKGSELSRVKFCNVDLRSSDFSNSTLTDVDFTGSILSSTYLLADSSRIEIILVQAVISLAARSKTVT